MLCCRHWQSHEFCSTNKPWRLAHPHRLLKPRRGWVLQQDNHLKPKEEIHLWTAQKTQDEDFGVDSSKSWRCRRTISGQFMSQRRAGQRSSLVMWKSDLGYHKRSGAAAKSGRSVVMLKGGGQLLFHKDDMLSRDHLFPFDKWNDLPFYKVKSVTIQ